MPDSGALDVAAIMGAVVIEKHFTYDKNRLGNDHYHSMDHDDLHNFKLRLYQYKLLAGSRDINWMGTQEGARLNARRSIVASAPIIAGDLITETNVTTKRPGTGITADQWDVVIGMRAAKNIEPDEIVMRHHLDWGVR
jgi:N-acetylneuraminate synthase